MSNYIQSYYETIRYLVPGILDSEFLLSDDGDGVVYISSWTSASPQPTPTEITNALPIASLAFSKTRLFGLLETKMKEEISKTITVSAVDYKVDSFNIGLINAAIKAYADTALTGSIAWLLDDGTMGTVDATDLADIVDAYGVRASDALDNASTLNAAIVAATDETTLNAVDITIGWPA
jgi:hypothetical protein